MPLAGAQVRGGAISSGWAGGAGFHGGMGIRRASRSPLFLGDSYLYSDDFSSAGEVVPPGPQILILREPPAAEAAKEPKPEPLLIELQGDRYVRINSTDGNARAVPASTDYAELKAPARPVVAAPAPLAPVLLVYRDGRQEEIRDYTIADGVIYARGDYWTDGYWNKKIQLGALNLPATLKASQERGVKFVLPASPNEVVTRP
jgi:hypothetical protein